MMTANQQPAVDPPTELLEVLACDYRARPAGAPSFFDVQPAIRRVTRDGEGIRVDFDPAEREAVSRLIAAERLCCATIGWDLDDGPELTLRITATPAQLDVFDRFLRST
jgi:hypothetical protein